MPAPHPLRRISTGSLSTLARSQDRAHTSPSGLDFLQPAITELADEAATLSTNIQRLNDLHDALGTFNEAFAGGWDRGSSFEEQLAGSAHVDGAPTDLSFNRLVELQAAAAAAATLASPPVRAPSPSAAMGSSAPHPVPNPADMTYATAYSSTIDEPAPPPKPVAKKPVVKKGVSAVVKRKREAARLGMEKIINRLMESPTGLTIKDCVALSDLPQPKVNKHLIALVSKKVVTKNNIGGTFSYKWVGA
ncbi:hypothetical protein EHS25_007806 [Saitozyma podzolica]|uniref:DASH complex subunit DAM1 n=1 Tax=Saitozyma podzolica TaxID=1890683 RepID=A0A427YQV8_9TREE|nr:hypothetical protein EHS25_007806 [Saitozyma podzolica]